MRYHYDTEFIDTGRTIQLISIGIVAADRREYYAVSSQFDPRELHANPWLTTNVWPHLPLTPHNTLDTEHPTVKPRTRIARDVQHFLLTTDHSPELWAWSAAYDHVALCQLWGRMIDRPWGIPTYTRDLKQEWDRLGNPPLPKQAPGKHNALADAHHAAALARALLADQRPRPNRGGGVES